jgi:hypothetical protein
MLSVNKLRGKVSLLLIAGIMILCAGFALTGCGNAVLKVLNPQAGQCAVDFSLDSTNTAVLTSGNAKYPSIAGDNLTVEAWVKPGAPTSTASGIFGRYGTDGAILYVKGGMPKFAIRVAPTGTGTSTDYSVSGNALMQNVWYHLAGILTNDTHSHPTSTSCTTAVQTTESHHIDIYVDGNFVDCATTNSNGVADPARAALEQKESNTSEIGLLPSTRTPLVDGNLPSSDAQFKGTIDEVRLWTVARSRADIVACANVELASTGSGACSVDFTKLKGYWKMNECKGTNVADWSGAGSAGGIEVNGVIPWADGWVPGAPVVLLQ